MKLDLSMNMGTIIHVAFLLLVVLEGTWTADPVSTLLKDRGEWCNEHQKVHKRLDAIEERVQTTVDHLYSEVNSLLNTISGSSWALSVAPSGPLMDIFEEDSR
ncbi:placenta-specific protein 9 isoform X2 [Hyla sarda]|uniref:placenta-specific protein 9 isoform X2 n=1 Tax=Hyla sarda TaxID=327740 RepID=UPI0024C3E955|nr:placenta-specific protein 9 isoform X2 [Hyla sarda]